MNSNSIEKLIQEFLAALNILFNSQDKQAQKEANNYICKFDKLPESMEVALKILSMPNLSDEAYFNASQIIKTKFKFDFGNYTEQKDYLQNLLLFILDKISESSNHKLYIVSNLCMCFARGMIFSLDNFSFLMQKCVVKLNTPNNLKNLLYLCTIFNFLVEVYEDQHIVIDESFRDIFSDNLSNIETDVITFLNILVQKINAGKNELKNNPQPDPDLINLYKAIGNMVLETFSRWLEYGFQKQTLIKLSTEFVDILNYVFDLDPLNLEKHAQCICNLLQLDYKENEVINCGQLIMSKVLPLKDIYYQNKNNFDEDEFSFFIQIFTSLVGNNCESIFKEQRFDLIQFIVDLTEKCPVKSIGFIIDFWDNIHNYVFKSEGNFNQLLIQFKNIYIQEIKYFLNFVIFDDNIFKILNEQKKKVVKNNDDYLEVIEYRDRIKNFLYDFTRDFSFDFVFDNVIYPELEQIILNIKNNQNDISLWSKFEALLFLFESTCRNIKNWNNENLNNFILTIFDVPKEYRQITKTIAYIFDDLIEIKCYK